MAFELRAVGGLGRKIPTDWEHVEKHPLRAAPESALITVEKTLHLPWYVGKGQHDQGSEGACVGFGTSMMMDIINGYDERHTVRYNPWWLWDRAKDIDEWADTIPGDDNGTSVRAACDILRGAGHLPMKKWMKDYPGAMEVANLSSGVKKTEGIAENRWATTVDEMRAVLNLGLPVSIGINWYDNFDHPVQKQGEGWFRKGEYVIGDVNASLGRIRGGHCVCVYGASDRRQAFKIVNSWGRSYPLVWIPYGTMERLIHEDGEVALVSDLREAA